MALYQVFALNWKQLDRLYKSVTYLHESYELLPFNIKEGQVTGVWSDITSLHARYWFFIVKFNNTTARVYYGSV